MDPKCRLRTILRAYSHHDGTGLSLLAALRRSTLPVAAVGLTRDIVYGLRGTIHYLTARWLCTQRLSTDCIIFEYTTVSRDRLGTRYNLTVHGINEHPISFDLPPCQDERYMGNFAGNIASYQMHY
jgi:hypothetical protein